MTWTWVFWALMLVVGGGMLAGWHRVFTRCSHSLPEEVLRLQYESGAITRA